MDEVSELALCLEHSEHSVMMVMIHSDSSDSDRNIDWEQDGKRDELRETAA